MEDKLNELKIAVEQRIIKDVESYGAFLYGFNVGRATPDLIGNIVVSLYGTDMKIKDVSKVNVAGAQVVNIYPYDASNTSAILGSVLSADLGVGAVADVDCIRVTFPALSNDRRKQIVMTIKARMEESRVRIRAARRDVNDAISKLEKNKSITQDDANRYKKIIQELVDKGMEDVLSLFETKEKIILRID